MTLDTIRWGFIGCGQVTEKKSGPAFSLVAGSNVVAVMSRNRDKACSYAQRHNIKKYYTDAQALINDEDVNAVYIATPPSSHATYAIMAMKAGKPAYVEKPLAASYEECCRINRISATTQIPCFVAYYRRLLPYFQTVKQLLDKQTIGTITHAQILFAVPPRDLDYNRQELPWRVQRDIAGGGYFYDLAPHQIDLLQCFLSPIIKAKGYSTNRRGLYDTEDTVSACFQFADGTVGSGSWCFVAHESAKTDRIEIVGTKGKISFSVFNYDPISIQTENECRQLNFTLPTHVQLPLIENVVRHLQGKVVCTCNAISATSVNWVMDKILDKL